MYKPKNENIINGLEYFFRNYSDDITKEEAYIVNKNTNTMEELEQSYIINQALSNINNENIFEIMNLIPNSMILDNEDSDILSKIYEAFLSTTEIPTALPVFAFFAFVSSFCVKNNITFQIPLDKTVRTLDTWVTVLAPSGSAKTLSVSRIKSLIPTDVNGEKVVENNFKKANGAAKFAEELSELPVTIDGKNQFGFWIQDEFAQTLKQIENPTSPMADVKEYLLEINDHKPIERKTKAGVVSTKPLVITTLFINTFESYVNNISKESMTDGLVRRFNYVYTEKDKNRDFTNYAFYSFEELEKKLEDKFYDFFSSIEPNSNYTFSKQAKELYQKYFKLFWEMKYNKVLLNLENFYRTYMMESFKYAIFYHLILGKKGNEIDQECMMYGLKVSLLFADSVKKFFDAKNNSPSQSAKVQKVKADIEKYISYLTEEPQATYRLFQRKFSLKSKYDALIILKAVKDSKKIIHHNLFNSIEKDMKKEIDKRKLKEENKNKENNKIIFDDNIPF